MNYNTTIYYGNGENTWGQTEQRTKSNENVQKNRRNKNWSSTLAKFIGPFGTGDAILFFC